MDTRKWSARRIAFSVAVTVLTLALVPASLAAKGGNGGGKGSSATSGTLSLYVLDGGNWVENGQPSYGGTVKFEISTNATTAPNVELVCSQNGAVVYAALSGWYETGTWTRVMALSSNAWTGGAADCTATLYYISGLHTVTLGTLSFTAAA